VVSTLVEAVMWWKLTVVTGPTLLVTFPWEMRFDGRSFSVSPVVMYMTRVVEGEWSICLAGAAVRLRFASVKKEVTLSAASELATKYLLI
jgi:hypothetical protein